MAGAEELGRAEEKEAVIRIYYVRLKSLFSVRKKGDSLYLQYIIVSCTNTVIKIYASLM